MAKIGYQCAEFYAPYYESRPEYARQIRQELDELRVRCYSTRNDLAALKRSTANY